MKRIAICLILLLAGCAEVNMTPAWQARVVTWNATEQQIARWAAAPDACDTCVGELTREQARTFLIQRADMWQEIIIAMRGGDPNE